MAEDSKSRHSAKKTATVSMRKPWTNAQRLAFVVALLSLVGVITTAVCANWDKFYKPLITNDRSTAYRIDFGNLRHGRAERTLNEAESNIDEGVRLSWQSEELSAETKNANAEAGARLLSRVRMERSKIQENHEQWIEAANADDHVRADLLQADTGCRMTILQRHVDNTLNESKLKTFVKPIEFRMGLQEHSEHYLNQPNEPLRGDVVHAIRNRD
jgi:hypothetical protein